jgi:hypothetical protein
VFTTERQILAVAREDQTKALKRKVVKREVLISEVIAVITTYRKVKELQYMVYHHQIGVNGTVSLTDGKTYKWSIEPGYAATVTAPNGDKVYLLHPDAKTEPKVRGDAK